MFLLYSDYILGAPCLGLPHSRPFILGGGLIEVSLSMSIVILGFLREGGSRV